MTDLDTNQHRRLVHILSVTEAVHLSLRVATIPAQSNPIAVQCSASDSDRGWDLGALLKAIAASGPYVIAHSSNFTGAKRECAVGPGVLVLASWSWRLGPGVLVLASWSWRDDSSICHGFDADSP
ncbi:hypothetical protein JX266_013327 [Neoarthrinium moseri]|nr:hypothetical protein JX266_013327 [Neoarthrinium moseri]